MPPALEVNFPHVPMQNGDVCFDLMGRQPALDVWMETFLFKSRIYMDLPRIDGKIRKNGDINYKLVTKIVGWWPGTFIASSRLEDDHEWCLLLLFGGFLHGQMHHVSESFTVLRLRDGVYGLIQVLSSNCWAMNVVSKRKQLRMLRILKAKPCWKWWGSEVHGPPISKICRRRALVRKKSPWNKWRASGRNLLRVW